MKDFFRYSKNRFLYSLLKFIVIGLLAYLGFSYFSTMQVHAVDFSGYSLASKVTGTLTDDTGFETVSYNCTSFAADGRCFGTVNSSWSKWYSNLSYTLYFETQLIANQKYQLDFIIYATPSMDQIPFTTRELAVWWNVTNWNGFEVDKYLSTISSLGGGYYKVSVLFSIPGVNVKGVTLHTGTSEQLFFTNADTIAFTRYYKLTKATDNSDIIMSQDKIYGAQQETNDKLDDIDDYLTDDTPPAVDDSELSSVFDSVATDNPLDYLLTLPLNLVSKLQSSLNSACTTFSLGTLYGKELTLPCVDMEEVLGSDLWSIIDILAGISLIVPILAKLYHDISNMLTMGAEKEASKMFSYMSPMEFLNYLLGGGR